MEKHSEAGKGGESKPHRSHGVTDALTISIIQRYSKGEISSREAAKAIGPQATEYDVFASLVAANLPLPQPTQEELSSQVAALRALYGPNWPRSHS